MPVNTRNHRHTDRNDDGPAWTARGVELYIAETDRAQLQDYGIHLLLTTVEETMAAIAAMRRRQAPTDPDPQRALSAATHIGKIAQALRDELLASEWLSHGRAAVAMGVSRSTAQRSRESATAGTRHWSYRHAIGHRPQYVTAREWYNPDLATSELIDGTGADELSVSVPGGEFPVSLSVNKYGHRTVSTESRVIVVNGDRLVIRSGDTRQAHGFTWYGVPYGITGHEDR